MAEGLDEIAPGGKGDGASPTKTQVTLRALDEIVPGGKGDSGGGVGLEGGGGLGFNLFPAPVLPISAGGKSDAGGYLVKIGSLGDFRVIGCTGAGC